MPTAGPFFEHISSKKKGKRKGNTRETEGNLLRLHERHRHGYPSDVLSEELDSEEDELELSLAVARLFLWFHLSLRLSNLFACFRAVLAHFSSKLGGSIRLLL